jgi:PAS domain S-box-containing protein
MLIACAELAGLCAAVIALGVLGGEPQSLPKPARWPMLSLLLMLSFNHVANLLEQLGMAWVDAVADHLSIATPLLWGLFLLEIGRAHLSSQVRAGEAQFSFILEKLPVSIASVSEDGNLHAFSQAWKAAFPASQVGRTLSDVLTPALSPLLAGVSRCARGGTEESVREELVVDAGGGRHFYRWAMRGVEHPDRERVSVLLILENLTLEVEGQAKLAAASDELMRLRRMGDLGQLAAGAAHDLNNLLQIIHAALWQLEVEGQRGETVDSIRSAVDACSAMTRGLLHLGRGAPARYGPFDLAELLDQLFGPLSHALGRSHELVISLPAERRVLLRGNPLRMQQALLNLVINARDAMPRGGRIAIRVELDAQHIVLSVRDTGHGMTEDVRSKLFTPFFTTKGERGTGLGLGVVRSAVEELHGQVVVESQLGAGTTFRLHIPRFQESTSHAPLSAQGRG